MTKSTTDAVTVRDEQLTALMDRLSESEYTYSSMDEDHYSKEYGISKDKVKRYLSAISAGSKSSNQAVVDACRIIMHMGESVESKELHEVVYAEALGDFNMATLMIRYLTQRTFAIDSPRTQCLPPAQREAISHFVPEEANKAIDGDTKYKVYLINDSKGRQYTWKRFAEMTKVEITVVLTDCGFERDQEGQLNEISKMDRSKSERYLRDDTVFLRRKRVGMRLLLELVTDLIEACDDGDLCSSYSESLEHLSTLSQAQESKIAKGEPAKTDFISPFARHRAPGKTRRKR